MIYLVITSLLQEFLAVAGEGECYVSYVLFPSKQEDISYAKIMFTLLSSNEFVLSVSYGAFLSLFFVCVV